MLRDWRKLLFWGGCAFFAGWILWWASSGYPLEGPICPSENAKNDCTSYNVIFYSAWQVAQFATHWSVLITAFATVAIGYFTFTLKESTDKLWIAGEKQFAHVKKQAWQAFLDRGTDLNRLNAQMRIAQQSADAAKQTAEAAAQQAKVAEAALTQLERPYIFVFGVRGIRQDAETEEFFIEYTVANYGKMPAIIEAPHIGFVISDRGSPPLPPRLFDGHSLLISPIMQAGEQRENIREYVPTGMVGEDILVQIERRGVTSDGEVAPMFAVPEDFDVFFRAVITYRGPLTTGHETGALWLYNHASYEFAVRGGDEDNYVK